MLFRSQSMLFFITEPTFFQEELKYFAEGLHSVEKYKVISTYYSIYKKSLKSQRPFLRLKFPIKLLKPRKLSHQNQRFHSFDSNNTKLWSNNIFILPNFMKQNDHLSKSLINALKLIIQSRYKLLRSIMISEIMLLIHIDSIEKQTNKSNRILKSKKSLLCFFMHLQRIKVDIDIK